VRTIHIETVTLSNGATMDIIRDVETVKRMASIATKAMNSIRDFPCGHKPNGLGGSCPACDALAEWDVLNNVKAKP